jgi:hypothetical protein
VENPGILNWRRWSAVRKAQVIATATGALATLTMSALDIALRALSLELPRYSAFSDCLFLLFMALTYPAAKIGDLLGIPQSASIWLWTGMAVFVNTFLFFLLGTVVGWLITRTKTEME